MSGIKEQTMRELRALGYNKITKPGIGEVKLEQAKTSQLLTFLAQVKA